MSFDRWRRCKQARGPIPPHHNVRSAPPVRFNIMQYALAMLVVWSAMCKPNKQNVQVAARDNHCIKSRFVFAGSAYQCIGVVYPKLKSTHSLFKQGIVTAVDCPGVPAVCAALRSVEGSWRFVELCVE